MISLSELVCPYCHKRGLEIWDARDVEASDGEVVGRSHFWCPSCKDEGDITFHARYSSVSVFRDGMFAYDRRCRR